MQKFLNLYLRAKKIYKNEINLAKKTYDQYYILNAKNPCKAAWSLVIEANSSKNEIKCAASPDEFNSFILRAVERIVQSFTQSLDCVVTSLDFRHPSCSFFFWKLVRPAKIVKTINSFKYSSNQDIYMGYQSQSLST